MKILGSSLVLSALALFVFAACSENKTANTGSTDAAAVTNNRSNTAAPPANAATNEAADAREIYTQSCANCHKEDGTGGKKTIEGKTIDVDNLTTDKMKKMADEKYVDYIKNGIPDEGMPAFKDRLSDEEIKAVVKFIRTDLQKQ